MEHRERKYFAYLKNAEEAFTILSQKGYTYSTNDIWQILQYQLDCIGPMYAEVIHAELSVDQIVEYVIAYNISLGEELGSITLPSTIIPAELIVDALEKAEIRLDGEIWTVHKNDADPFPSQPHAHNYDTRLKLDLGSGKLYRQKQEVGRINKKQLITLRGLIRNKIKGIDLPKLLYHEK